MKIIIKYIQVGEWFNSNLEELDKNIRLAKKLGHSGFKMRVGKQDWKNDVKKD